MAMWNAPSEDSMHVDNACRGVLSARAVSEDINADFEARGLPIFRTRFGLHTDEVLVGNVGAGDRLQFTCLGAGVNLASRLEGLNKYYGTQILVTDKVRKRASSEFLFRRVDIVEAKGTSVPVTIYELMGERGTDVAHPVDAEAMHCASKYETAFDHYLHRDFDDAVAILAVLETDHPNDPVVRQLLAKCRHFLSDNPNKDWSGSTSLDRK